jgi:two-component system, chemotaxis family, sensor kinase CheA
MAVDISQFYEAFFIEAEELLTEMERLLLIIDTQSPDSEQLNAIFRAAHSIKGGAATFGFAALTQLTHVLESLLDKARQGEMALTSDMIDTFLQAKDVMQDQLNAYRSSTEPDPEALAKIAAQLQRFAKDSVSAHPVAAAPAFAPVPVAPVVETAPVPNASQVPAPAPGMHRLQVVFTRVDPKDMELLLIELGHLGTISNRFDIGDNVTVWLDTINCSLDDVTAVCCFVIDESQIKVTEVDIEGASAAPVKDVPPPEAGISRYEVIFSKVDSKDLEQLLVELGHLGTLVNHIEAMDSVTIWLDTTNCTVNDVTAVCCFIVDDSQVSVTAMNTPVAVAPAARPAAAPPPSPKPAVAVPPPPKPAVAASAAPLSSSSTPSSAPAKPTAPAAKPANAKAAAHENTSIRVGVEKVDLLINLVGELVITQAMLAQTASTLDPVLHERLLSGMGQLERNARDLQEAVMSIRMMPMDYVFSRFPRMVRDLAAKLNKQIDLVTFGQATELDKGLIERIIDPLTHLVRNSLDHGIERPNERIAAGKNATGKLTLSAAHQGGNIVIEVGDDGAGLRRDKILAKAMSQGLPVSENMADEEVWQLIFMPGFSTAEQVTDVSGRGVGMDVVKRNIQEMGGHVEIRSVLGKGTTIRIVLPLTLAILDGMSVKVGAETFILPLNYVMESLQPNQEDIYPLAGDGKLIKVRGEYLPLIALHNVFSIYDARNDPTQGIVVILQAEQRMALLVDELLGQHQVVVKNLEANYRKVHGVAAATILGDGSVALIVDVPALRRDYSYSAGRFGSSF